MILYTSTSFECSTFELSLKIQNKAISGPLSIRLHVFRYMYSSHNTRNIFRHGPISEHL